MQTVGITTRNDLSKSRRIVACKKDTLGSPPRLDELLYESAFYFGAIVCHANHQIFSPDPDFPNFASRLRHRWRSVHCRRTSTKTHKAFRQFVNFRLAGRVTPLAAAILVDVVGWLIS